MNIPAKLMSSIQQHFAALVSINNEIEQISQRVKGVFTRIAIRGETPLFLIPPTPGRFLDNDGACSTSYYVWRPDSPNEFIADDINGHDVLTSGESTIPMTETSAGAFLAMLQDNLKRSADAILDDINTQEQAANAQRLLDGILDATDTGEFPPLWSETHINVREMGRQLLERPNSQVF